MKTLLSIIGGLVGGAIMVSIFFICQPVEQADIGSVARAGEYHYTQLTGAVATTSLIKTGVGTLGSVVITEDQAGAVIMFDSATTSSTGLASSTYATRIADFETAQAEGVYTFDVSFKKGLVFQSADGAAFAGDWTITWR